MIKSRLKQFIAYQQISVNEFCRINDLSNSYFNNESAVGSDKLLNIFKNFPQLNMDWVITGRAEMLYNSHQNLHDMNNSNEPSLHWGKLIKACIDELEITDEEVSKETGLSIDRLRTMYTHHTVDLLEISLISQLIQFDLYIIFNNINNTSWRLPSTTKNNWITAKKKAKTVIEKIEGGNDQESQSKEAV